MKSEWKLQRASFWAETIFFLFGHVDDGTVGERFLATRALLRFALAILQNSFAKQKWISREKYIAQLSAINQKKKTKNSDMMQNGSKNDKELTYKREKSKSFHSDFIRKIHEFQWNCFPRTDGEKKEKIDRNNWPPTYVKVHFYPHKFVSINVWFWRLAIIIPGMRKIHKSTIFDSCDGAFLSLSFFRDCSHIENFINRTLTKCIRLARKVDFHA